MANENPSPASVTADPTQVEVILAGNIAADDLLWIVRCSVSELHGFFRSPVSWVASLGDLPGWRYVGSADEAPAPVLLPDLALTAKAASLIDPDGWVTLQGISETNAVAVLATVESAVASAALLGSGGAGTDPLASFWAMVAADPGNPPSLKKPFLVNVVPQLRRFYGHFEVVGEGGSPEERAALVATFLLASVFDPAGLAAMLGGLDQETLYVLATGPTMGKAIGIVPTSSGQVASGFYANMESAPAVSPDDDPPVAGCYILDGTYTPPSPPDDQGGSGQPGGGVIKRYGVE